MKPDFVVVKIVLRVLFGVRKEGFWMAFDFNKGAVRTDGERLEYLTGWSGASNHQ